MKSVFLIIFTLLVFFPVFADAQKLPPTFTFSKEDVGEGNYVYSLKPEVSEIYKKFGRNSPYQIVGAVARLDTQRAVILFANSQKNFQLATQSDKSVSVIADSYKITDLEYKLAGKSEGDTMYKLEIGNAIMDYPDFEKIMNADSILVKYGAVSYNFDEDNIEAFHYLAAQIAKDTKKSKNTNVHQ